MIIQAEEPTARHGERFCGKKYSVRPVGYAHLIGRKGCCRDGLAGEVVRIGTLVE